MKPMTTHERIRRVYEHLEPDRVPITDWLWESTWDRWKREGLPEDMEWERFFDIDRIVALDLDVIDTTPRYPYRIIEETDTYRIDVDWFGVTKKNFKPVSSTPQYLDFTIKDPGTWREAKQRMAPSRDRIRWDTLKRNYKSWRKEGAWIIASPWFGFDVSHSRMCGTETVLTAMAAEPEWAMDMFNHGWSLARALIDMIWEEGYTFDELFWYDDMSYKAGTLFSKKMWREMVRPYQQQVIDWAHAHGIKAHLHCCGNINALVPDLVDMGLDALNPLEVKAGMDPLSMKKTYGKDLVLRGGFNTLHWDNWETVESDIRTVLPGMMESGGYIFASDHSIPDTTSLETYRRIVQLVKEIGAY